MSDSQLSKLVDTFKHDERLLVVYLFGSVSKGLQTQESDTDIAVLLSDRPKNMLDYYLDLMERIFKLIGGDIDLVVLNTAPPLLKYQVIKHGKVLFSRDETARVKFEARTGKEYMDFAPRRHKYDEALVEEISKWKG